MTHDPLCGVKPSDAIAPEKCWRCALVARVREDERMKAYADWDWPAFVVRRIARKEALRDALVAVVNTDGDYYSGANMLLVDAYRAGLEAAREAVEALGGEQ